MGYIQRKGIIITPSIVLISAAVLALLYIQGDWDRQFTVLLQYNQFTSPLESAQMTIIITYFVLSLLIAIIWYLLGKSLSPLFSGYLSTFFGGLKSTTFIDVNVNKYNLTFAQFSEITINSIIIIFSIDLFLSNSIFYVSGNLPTFTSLLIAVAILSIFEPLNLVYNSIGVRSYDPVTAEVIGISSVLDRFAFRLLSTGGLLGVFASISINQEIFDQIPVAIRVIFVRSVSIGLMIVLFYSILFQPEGILKDWKNRNIKAGKTKVDFRK